MDQSYVKEGTGTRPGARGESPLRYRRGSVTYCNYSFTPVVTHLLVFADLITASHTRWVCKALRKSG